MAQVDKIVFGSQIDPISRKWSGHIVIDNKLLGFARIFVEKVNDQDKSQEVSRESLPLIIIRKSRLIDHIFTGSVALLVSLLYINFGAALDLSVLRSLIIKPVVSMLFIVDYKFNNKVFFAFRVPQ